MELSGIVIVYISDSTMKNYISIFLCFVFLLSFIGIAGASSVCEKQSVCQSCESTSGECSAASENSCCSIDIKLEKLTTDLNYTGERPEIASLLLFPSWIENLQFPDPLNEQHDSYVHYSPPLSIRDIPVLVQNFRI